MQLFQNPTWWVYVIVMMILLRGYLGSLRNHEDLIGNFDLKLGKPTSPTVDDLLSLAWRSVRTIALAELAMVLAIYWSPITISLVLMSFTAILGLAWGSTEIYTAYKFWKLTKDN